MDGLNDLLTEYPWLELLSRCLVAALAGYLLHAALDRGLRRVAKRYRFAERVMWHARRPAQWLIVLLFVHLSLVDATEPASAVGTLRQGLSIAIILLVTALVIRLVGAFVDIVSYRHPTDGPDNLRARSVQTKVRVLARTAMFIIGVVGVGSVLMTFPNVRQIGASLLASAGVAGIAAGLAARPVLGNLIAGLQIALTQPIRIDDVLIVEGEFGRVEEITETYVVVCIWDERRMVVPLEYFIQNPFQNWTRNASQMIGSVFFWVDYRMPVAPLREKLRQMIEEFSDWDRRVCDLQVTDVSERAMQLRVLVSAANAANTWNLRCKVRERLITFMQEEFPAMLPQTRATLTHAHGDAPDRQFGVGLSGDIGRPAGADAGTS